MVFPIIIDRVDRLSLLIPPNPLNSCHALHENRVTSAHHEEVVVSASGHASVSPSGTANIVLEKEVDIDTGSQANLDSRGPVAGAKGVVGES
jgi:hypothetical protein